MWRLALVTIAAVCFDTVPLSAQSEVPAVYRLIELIRGRSAPAPVEPNPRRPRCRGRGTIRQLPRCSCPSRCPRQVPSRFRQPTYGIPVRPVYKSYAVYHPSKEPPGYIDWLERQEPQVVFDAAKLQTPADWIAAGELVFDAPIAYGRIGGPDSRLVLARPEVVPRHRCALGPGRYLAVLSLRDPKQGKD